MKNLIYSILILLIFTPILVAQEKSKLKNVQEETITTTTVTKGITEETSVAKTKTTENQVIKIKDTGVENQNEVYSSVKSSETNKIDGEVIVNKENEAALEELKKAQQKEIEEGKKEQLLKYEAERKAMEDERPEKFKKKDNDSDN